jgi:hypothetical protein
MSRRQTLCLKIGSFGHFYGAYLLSWRPCFVNVRAGAVSALVSAPPAETSVTNVN